MPEIYLSTVFEDDLSGAVVDRILSASQREYVVATRHNSGGYGWIKSRIRGFNNAAKGMPYLVLTDLDVCECAPSLIRHWLARPKHPNLLLRVAVREVESWLLACKEPLAAFLGILENRIPTDVDDIRNPKEFLVNLARGSRKRDIRLDLVPRDGSTARVGPDYNGRLMRFVDQHWDPATASRNSPSLQKTLEALEVFTPILADNTGGTRL